MNLKLPYCIIISLILIVGLFGNIFIWKSPAIGLTFGPAYLLFFGFMLGFILYRSKPAIFQFIYGLLYLLAGLAFWGALLYYFYQLNNLAVASLILFIPLVLLPFLKYGNHLKTHHDFNPVQINPHILRTTFLVAAFIFLTILNFRYLLGTGTVEAIRTPWKILPGEFFITYFSASAILLYFILKSQKEGLNLALISIHVFLTVSIVLFVYRVGYGFDPFIHQATEKVIAAEGFILPKPFYYLGQYALVVFFSKISLLPIIWIDKLLLPISLSLFLPSTIYYSLKPFVAKNLTPSASLLPLLILILPFSAFIATTPQGLANLFLLITIFLGLLALRREFPVFDLWFLSFATIFIHPLAGLPSLIFVFLITLFIFFKKQEGIFEFLRHLVFIGSFVLSAVAIPLLFLFAILFFQGPTNIFSLKTLESSPNLLNALGWNLPVWINNFQPVLDLVYTYGKNIPFLVLGLGLTGYFLIKKYLPQAIIFVMVFLALIINYILIKLFIDFPALIKYEQKVFPERILEISFYFLIPLFLFALYQFFAKLEVQKKSLKFFFFLLFPLLLTFSLYYSYPKDDGEDYQIDRGYSVSASDIYAVQQIERDAAGADYLVLANQSVSAAAVREFGFKQYYGPHFYYPIPTGDPLYQSYLKMVYEKPSRAAVTEASELTGVRLIYFVLNQYWTDADKIKEAAQLNADDSMDIDGGKVLIFKYKL